MFYRHGSQQLFRCPNHLQDYYLQLEEEKESASYQKLTKFIQTVEPIVQLLKTLEGQKLSLYRPGQTVVSETGEMVEAGRHDRKDTSNGGRQLAVAQEGQDGQQKVSVEIHATGEAASLTAEAEQEKERIRKQNELPIWHKQSVINGVSANVSATTGTTSAIPVTTATSSSIVLGDEAQSQPVSIVTGGVATKLTGEDLSNEAEEDIMDYYNQYYANYAAKAAAVKPNEQPVKSDVKMDDASVKTISIDSSRSIKAQLIEEIDSEMIDSDEDEEFIEAT